MNVVVVQATKMDLANKISHHKGVDQLQRSQIGNVMTDSTVNRNKILITLLLPS